ncbi:RNA 2',3'-cyclic phosphodiesterase [candidate division KSB1 bacterium]|nr:RNA 2',3'-cyclic phosphodiesterase [candidate division KSB1 bacterium]
MEQIRTFIAIEIPASIQKQIALLQNRLKSVGEGISWVKTNNIHLTLKFLGDVPANLMQQVIEATKKACMDVKSFDLEIKGTGFFPDAKRPRVLWVGCEEKSGGLQKIHQGLDSMLSNLGFEKEMRKFSPHLTIGRVKDGRKLGDIPHLLQQSPFKTEKFLVAEVIVMKSQLHPAGSIYTPLAKIKFENI